MKKAMLFLACSLLTGCFVHSGETIEIGYIGPLTGDASAYGNDTLHGVQLAIDEWNERGGAHGKQIHLIAEDGQCNGAGAASAARKLADIDNVSAILGGNCSAETLGAAPIAEETHTLLLSPISSNSKITEAGDYVFRVYPSGTLGGKAYAQYFQKFGYRSIGILSEDTDYCRGLQSMIRASLPEGAEILFDEIVDPGTKDFRSLYERLRSIDLDVLFLNTQSAASVAVMITQLREAGIDVQVVANDTADSAILPGIVGDAIEGMHLVAIASPDSSRSQAVAFMDEFDSRYGEPRQSFFYAALAYDAANILLTAFSQTDGSSDALKEYLYNMTSYAGVMGDISFDENGDVRGVAFGLKEWKNGKREQLMLMSL